MLVKCVFKFIGVLIAVLFLSENSLKAIPKTSAQTIEAPKTDLRTVTFDPFFPLGDRFKIVYAKTVADSRAIASPLPKKLNSISSVIGRPGPILSETVIIDGKNVCAHENDHPSKSKKNPKGHIDGECCLDLDETPNSLCYYPYEKYAKLIQRYLNSKK